MTLKNYGEKIEYLADRWVLPASLTHDNLAFHWSEVRQKMPKSGVWHVDAHRLHEIDSSTLSFLLECLRSARRYQVTLKLTALNAKIKALLQVYGVAHLFEKIIED
jgi:phospholipid transport system transporter-binding protein